MNNVSLTYFDSKPIRLDKFIADNIEEVSRNAVISLIETGNVLVNQKTVAKSYKLKQNDIVNITIPDPVFDKAEPENIPLDIVYEDNDLLVVNKPKGMVVHPAPGNYRGTLVHALLSH